MGLFDKLLGSDKYNLNEESCKNGQALSSIWKERLRGAIILSETNMFAADKIFEEIADETHDLEAMRHAINSKITFFHMNEAMFDQYPGSVNDSLAEVDKAIGWIEILKKKYRNNNAYEEAEIGEWLARCYETKGKFLYHLNLERSPHKDILKKGIELGSNKSKLYLALTYHDEAKQLVAGFDESYLTTKNYNKNVQKRIDSLEERVNDYYSTVVDLLEDYVSNYSEVGATAYELSKACRMLSAIYERGQYAAQNISRAEYLKNIAEKEEEKWNERFAELAKGKEEIIPKEEKEMDGMDYFNKACELLFNGEESYDDVFRGAKYIEQVTDDLLSEEKITFPILNMAAEAKNMCSYPYEHLLSHTDDASLARSFIDDIDKGLYYLDLIDSKYDKDFIVSKFGLSDEDIKGLSDKRGRFNEFKGIYLYKINDPSCSQSLNLAKDLGSNRAKLYLTFYKNDTVEDKDWDCYSEMVALLESYIAEYSSVGEGSQEIATAYEWLANYYEHGVGVEQDSEKAEFYRNMHDKLIANYEEERMQSWNDLCQRAPWVTETN